MVQHPQLDETLLRRMCQKVLGLVATKRLGALLELKVPHQLDEEDLQLEICEFLAWSDGQYQAIVRNADLELTKATPRAQSEWRAWTGVEIKDRLPLLVCLEPSVWNPIHDPVGIPRACSVFRFPGRLASFTLLGWCPA